MLIIDSTFTANTAAYGGAVLNFATQTIIDSTFTANSATQGGGAAYNDGAMSIVGSTVSGNTSLFGGGLFNYNYATLDVAGSTVADNSANYGAGVDNQGTLTLTGSTISGNAAANLAGGLSNVGGGFAASATVTDCTFSNNTARGVPPTTRPTSAAGGDFQLLRHADAGRLDPERQLRRERRRALHLLRH